MHFPNMKGNALFSLVSSLFRFCLASSRIVESSQFEKPVSPAVRPLFKMADKQPNKDDQGAEKKPDLSKLPVTVKQEPSTPVEEPPKVKKEREDPVAGLNLVKKERQDPTVDLSLVKKERQDPSVDLSLVKKEPQDPATGPKESSVPPKDEPSKPAEESKVEVKKERSDPAEDLKNLANAVKNERQDPAADPNLVKKERQDPTTDLSLVKKEALDSATGLKEGSLPPREEPSKPAEESTKAEIKKERSDPAEAAVVKKEAPDSATGSKELPSASKEQSPKPAEEVKKEDSREPPKVEVKKELPDSTTDPKVSTKAIKEEREVPGAEPTSLLSVAEPSKESSSSVASKESSSLAPPKQEEDDDAEETEKYILTPEAPLTMKSVRRALDMLFKGRDLALVMDYADEQKMLADLPDPKSEHAVILIPVLSNGRYLLFEAQKYDGKLYVYSSQKETVGAIPELKKVQELLKKKGYSDFKVEHPAVEQASSVKDSGIFIAIYAQFNILKEDPNYKVLNSKTIREKMYEFLKTRDPVCLDQMVIEGYTGKPTPKVESTGFAAPLPKTNITGTMILPPASSKSPSPAAPATPIKPPPPASALAPAKPSLSSAVKAAARAAASPTSPVAARPSTTAQPAPTPTRSGTVELDSNLIHSIRI